MTDNSKEASMNDIKPVSIKTAKERFQAYMKAKGIPLSSSLVHINKISQFEEQERKELRAALEALQAENAVLKEESQNYENASRITHEWSMQIGLANSELRETNAAQAKEVTHWKSNHADLKERLYVATHRTDLPSDRLSLFDKMKAEIAVQAKRIAELQEVIEHLGKVSDICTKLYTKKICANCRCKESQKGEE